MTFKQFKVVLLFVSIACALFAKERPFFTSIGTREGLPNSSVSSIVQDEKGFLWLGTQGGLVRYDGYEFKQYENAPFVKNALPHDQIQTMYSDATSIWIGTYGGLSHYDTITNTFTNYLHNPDEAESIRGNLVVSISRDKNGALWVGTSRGLDRFDEQTLSFIHYSPSEFSSGVPNAMIRDIHLDKRGNLWVAVQGHGLFQYVYEKDTFLSFTHDPKNPLSIPGNDVMSITEDAAGALWFGIWGVGIAVLEDPTTDVFKTVGLKDTRVYFVNAHNSFEIYVGTWGGGLFLYSIETGTIEHFINQEGKGSIPNNVVYSSFADSNNVVWLGTNGGGLARTERADASYRMFLHSSDNPSSLPMGKVTAILEDSQKNLWVGVYSGGLSRLDRDTGDVEHYRYDSKNPKSLPNDIINNLYEDSFGVLWIATNNGLGRYDARTDSFNVYRADASKPGSIADSVIYAITEAPDGNLWIGTYTKGLNLFMRETETFAYYPPDPTDSAFPQDSLVYALSYDKEGVLWVGYNNGLDSYKNGIFKRYRYDIENKNGISSNTVRNIYRDSKGGLWLGTVGGGLMQYNYENDTFRHITKNEGLPHNTVRSILEADTGDIWIGTAKGIGVIDRDGLTAKGFSVYNDLMDRDFHTGAWKASDGYLYFGGQSTVYQLNSTLEVSTRPLPKTILSEISINGRRLDTYSEYSITAPHVDSLRLKYNQNNFAVTFATVDYREPLRNLYSYKLEGFDKDWSFPSSQHTATYTNLPGGSYVLHVKASDNEGYWNNEAISFSVVVASPPWLTLPAFVIYFSILVALGYIIASLRGKKSLHEKIIEMTHLQKELQEANLRLDELSMRDGLTGIANRRRLSELFPVYLADAMREQKPLSVFMIDIDFFKGYNDVYGHVQGDETLKMVAATLTRVTERATDLVARFGGEEFLVVLPNTDKNGAEKMAARILQTIENLQIPNESSTVNAFVTVSAGIATCIPDMCKTSVSLVEEADRALYRAKAEGRNCYR